ncbi:MAG: hypothetical protein ACRYGP_06495 [Janthinobacterium lividum]
MIGETLGSRTVIAFPRSVSDAATTRQGGTARSSHPADPRPHWTWRVSSAGGVTLGWIVDSILVGLAYAAAAHGPVSPDMLHEVHEMDRRRRRP